MRNGCLLRVAQEQISTNFTYAVISTLETLNVSFALFHPTIDAATFANK